MRSGMCALALAGSLGLVACGGGGGAPATSIVATSSPGPAVSNSTSGSPAALSGESIAGSPASPTSDSGSSSVTPSGGTSSSSTTSAGNALAANETSVPSSDASGGSTGSPSPSTGDNSGSSSGGGSGSSPTGSGSNSDTSSSGNSGGSSGSASGQSGGTLTLAVSPAARPSLGNHSTPAPKATSPTPNFFGVNVLPNFGTAFPLLQTVMRITSSSVTPDTATNDAGATLTYGAGNVIDGFALSIPSLGITLTTADAVGRVTTIGNSLTTKVVYTIDPFTYALPGLWGVSKSDAVTYAAFTTGLETPVGALPSVGSATYRGDAFALVFTPTKLVTAGGDASFSVNFSTATLTGLFTNMLAFDGNATGAFNDVTLSAHLDSTTDSFSGQTSANSSGAEGLSLKSNATGTVEGKFYGPTAQELGAVWTLSDGTSTVIGSAGATSAPLPTVGAAAPASSGPTPQPTVLAQAGGGAFDGSGTSPAGQSFPAISSTLQFTASGVASPNIPQSATLIVDVSSASSTLVRLLVPSVNLDAVATFSHNLATAGNGGSFGGGGGDYASISGLSYTSLGMWTHTSEGPFDLPQNVTAYVVGYETPGSAVPQSGSATYSGAGAVKGVILQPDGVHIAGANLSGDATLTANFAAGSVTGAFTNMKANDGVDTPWNDVSVAASIAAGTNRFNGTTHVTTQPASPYALKGSATGSINGAFYGPAADNIGAIWSLNDGTATALGGVAVKR